LLHRSPINEQPSRNAIQQAIHCAMPRYQPNRRAIAFCRNKPLVERGKVAKKVGEVEGEK
jgi:hypothetical protein